MIKAKFPDRTELEARIEGSMFIVTAIGSGDSLAAIGQQLSWLNAALSSSPYAVGIATRYPTALCTPQKETLLSSRKSEVGVSTDSFCAIGFAISQLSRGEDRPHGHCWHEMFMNPVMAVGYPILTKQESGLGLEIPLNVIAEFLGRK